MANNTSFTPQEIEQFLQQFFDVVGARQYIGARYVPIFGRKDEDTVEWDSLAPYEPLTVVMHDGVSYVSRRYVPKGIDIANTDYWMMTYRFNAQVEQYRQEVLQVSRDITEVINTMNSDFVPFPTEFSKYGTTGQVLSTLANGDTKWTDPVVPSDAQAEAVITQWLNDHPEATTTVLDNSITNAKLVNGTIADEKLVQTGGILERFRTLQSLFDNVIGSYSSNTIDASALLNATGWTYSNGQYKGPINNIINFRIVPYGIKPNTIYNLSIDAYNETQQGTAATGLVVYLHCTDGTTRGIYFPNDTAAFSRRNVAMLADTTVDYIYFINQAGSSAPNDTWHIRNVMLSEGALPQDYVPFELTANDRGLRLDMGADFNDVYGRLMWYMPKTVGRNLLDVNSSNKAAGLLANINGTLVANSAYDTIVMPIDLSRGSTLVCNTSWTYVSFYNAYIEIGDYEAGDVIPNSLGGYTWPATNPVPITIPENANCMVISIRNAVNNQQVEYGTVVTTYVPYVEGIPESQIIPEEPTIYDIYADGTGDFQNIRACFESITDSSPTKRYVVRLHEGTYDVASLWTPAEYEQTVAFGPFIPDYTELVGIGNRDNIVITGNLQSYNFYFSPMHMRSYGAIRNLTIIGTKCRYCVHDDAAINGIGGKREIENCRFVGHDLRTGCVYGSGLKEDNELTITDSVFDATDAGYGGGSGMAFLSHNQLGWSFPSVINIINNRFLNNAVEGQTAGYAMRLRTLNTDGTITANNMPVYVHMYGNVCNGILLREDESGQFGAGILYYVDGYYNLKAYEAVETIGTPIPVDERFDLI